MFDNAGERLHAIAIVFFIIGIIASIVSAIQVFALKTPLTILFGMLILIGGPILSWIFSLMLYAIGDAAENDCTYLIRDLYHQIDSLEKIICSEQNKNTLQANQNIVNKNICLNCGAMNKPSNEICFVCGQAMENTTSNKAPKVAPISAPVAPPKEISGIVCPKCSSKNPLNSEFCQICGNPFRAPRRRERPTSFSTRQ